MQNAWAEKTKTGYRGRYRDANKRKRVALFVPGHSETSEKKALRAAQKELAKLDSGTWFDQESGKATLDQYWSEIWWPNCSLEHNTKVTYESVYRNHIQPTFGHMELRRILPTHVQAWVKMLEEKKGQSGVTVIKHFGMFQSILAGRRGSSAWRDGFIERNPCTGTRLPVPVDHEVSIYEPEETKRLMLAMDPWWRPVVLMMTDTGMRPGEVFGVQIEDFTLGFKAVIVRRTIVQTSKKWQDGETPFRVKDYPKTRKPRTIPLTPECAQMVKELIRKRGLGPGDRLFSMPVKIRHSKKVDKPSAVIDARVLRTELWPGGVPVSKGTFKCVWNRAHRIAGVRRLRVYDLRATNISWLLDGDGQGASVPAVMELAGHRRITTTQKYVKARNLDTQGIEALRRVKGTG